MQTRSGDFELTTQELRAITGYDAADAHRAARAAPTGAALHAANAAGDAAAAAYLHPLATATQVRHILGAAAHAARAAELSRGEDPVVAEDVISAAARGR